MNELNWVYIRYSLESVYVLCMQKLSNVHEKSACKFWGSSEVNKSLYVA